jgi:hypothetical protein
MIPIPLLGGASLGPLALTLVATLAPAVLVWWNDRHLLQKRDDPALPELLASRRRANIRAIAFAVAIMIVFSGASVAWGFPYSSYRGGSVVSAHLALGARGRTTPESRAHAPIRRNYTPRGHRRAAGVSYWTPRIPVRQRGRAAVDRRR